MMKLTEIANIQSLNMEQSVAIKGGARDTRGSKRPQHPLSER